MLATGRDCPLPQAIGTCTADHPRLAAPLRCPCGEIGRRIRLKIERRKACWFESGQGHHFRSKPGTARSELSSLRILPRTPSPKWSIVRSSVLCLPFASCAESLTWATGPTPAEAEFIGGRQHDAPLEQPDRRSSPAAQLVIRRPPSDVHGASVSCSRSMRGFPASAPRRSPSRPACPAVVADRRYRQARWRRPFAPDGDGPWRSYWPRPAR